MRIVQPSLQLILEVMDIHLRIFESFPPQIQVTVTGAVPSRGWSQPQLIPYTYVQPPTGARGSSRAALAPPLRMGQDARWNLNGGRAQGVAQPQAASEACRQNIRRPVVDGTATLGPARGRKNAVVFPLRCCMLLRQID